jgi:hypothetical protein
MMIDMAETVETLNVGGDEDRYQRSQPASVGGSVSRNEVLISARDGTMDGTMDGTQIEGDGPSQNGDTDIQAEGSDDDARASSVSHSLATAPESTEPFTESSVDCGPQPRSNLGDQPDQSQCQEERDTTGATTGTNQANGEPHDQNKEIHLQAMSTGGGLVSSSESFSIDKSATGEEGKATDVAKSDLENTDQAGGSQKNGGHVMPEDESKKEQPAEEREPDSPTGGASQEYEVTSATQNTTQSWTSGSPDNDHLQAEREIKSKQQPKNITDESQKIESHLETESVRGDAEQAPSNGTQRTIAAAKDANKHSSINETAKMEPKEQPDSNLTLSEGESEVTNINGANQYDEYHKNGGVQEDDITIKVTVPVALDETFKVRTEVKQGQVIIRLTPLEASANTTPSRSKFKNTYSFSLLPPLSFNHPNGLVISI